MVFCSFEICLIELFQNIFARVWQPLGDSEDSLPKMPYTGKFRLLEDDFDKFDSRYKPDEKEFATAKQFLKSYLTDAEFREIIESRQFARLETNPNREAFKKVPIIEYIKDNVSLNQFME